MAHIIREYTHADVDGIKKCLIDLQEFERMLDPQRLEGIKVAHEYLAHLLQICETGKGKIYVVEMQEEIIGMISVYIEDSKKHFRKSHKFAYISDLMILPEYKDRGIAKELLEQAEEYARKHGATAIQSAVLEKHLEGINEYLRNGFHKYEVIVKKTL
ncbi:MAG: GNAT family N-acetyltransferase [Weeksellaceae bacterium]